MSLFTRFRHRPAPEPPAPEHEPAPDGPPGTRPDDEATAAGTPDPGATRDGATGHGAPTASDDPTPSGGATAGTGGPDSTTARFGDTDVPGGGDEAPDHGPAVPAGGPPANGGLKDDKANGDLKDDEADGGTEDDEADGAEAPGGRRLVGRRIAARAGTVLAGLLVFGALLLPNRLHSLTPGAFARIPVEALLGVGLLLALRAGPRRLAAVLAGVGLGLLTIMKILDMGFYAVLVRSFDLVLDWVLFDDAVDFLTSSIGRVGAIGVVVAAVLLLVALLALSTLAVLRLTRLLVRHETAATRGVVALGVVWLGCAALGVQLVPGVPVAARNTASLVHGRVHQVGAGLRDQQKFAEEAAEDAFRDVPADRLLTGLRGRDVIFAFVESYGRDAVEDPEFATQVGAVLDAGTQRLAAAGYASRSAFLTSPTAGGGSWLAHATFNSGLWIDNQARYRNLISSDRMTLPSAFRRASWQTVGVMPGITRTWPEGNFYGYDRLYDSRNIGYRGPKFSWAPMPDQYTLSAFERLENAKPDHPPMMVEIPLVSSHAPWVPVPRMIGWDEVGDGSVFAGMVREGDPRNVVWSDDNRVRAEYRRSIEYSLNTLVSYVERYGDENLVLVFLGDHQPTPLITGENASWDVPITIVAQDRAVLDRIAGWNWQDGLRPSPKAPVWRMDTFRDRFLGAFGTQAGSAGAPSPAPPG